MIKKMDQSKSNKQVKVYMNYNENDFTWLVISEYHAE